MHLVSDMAFVGAPPPIATDSAIRYNQTNRSMSGRNRRV